MMMAEKKNDKESVYKAVFDGRLHFHEVLKYYMLDYRQQMITNDFQGALTTLRQMLSMIASRLRQSDVQDIRKSISVARGVAGNTKTSRYVPDMINDIYDSIHSAGKDLFLPTNEDEDEEFDMEDFLRRSSL